jgi:hypothetical protein
MASFSTNPYNNFQAANSKEYIFLNKGAKQDFHPETHYYIIPGNSDIFLLDSFSEKLPNHGNRDSHVNTFPLL